MSNCQGSMWATCGTCRRVSEIELRKVVER